MPTKLSDRCPIVVDPSRLSASPSSSRSWSTGRSSSRPSSRYWSPCSSSRSSSFRRSRSGSSPRHSSPSRSSSLVVPSLVFVPLVAPSLVVPFVVPSLVNPWLVGPLVAPFVVTLRTVRRHARHSVPRPSRLPVASRPARRRPVARRPARRPVARNPVARRPVAHRPARRRLFARRQMTRSNQSHISRVQSTSRRCRPVPCRSACQFQWRCPSPRGRRLTPPHVQDGDGAGAHLPVRHHSPPPVLRLATRACFDAPFLVAETVPTRDLRLHTPAPPNAMHSRAPPFSLKRKNKTSNPPGQLCYALRLLPCESGGRSPGPRVQYPSPLCFSLIDGDGVHSRLRFPRGSPCGSRGRSPDL